MGWNGVKTQLSQPLNRSASYSSEKPLLLRNKAYILLKILKCWFLIFLEIWIKKHGCTFI